MLRPRVQSRASGSKRASARTASGACALSIAPFSRRNGLAINVRATPRPDTAERNWSPPHSAQIRVLSDLVPDARFIHICRDPYAAFASTMNPYRYNLDPQTRAEIARRWAPFIEKYGYQSSPAEV